MAAATNTSKVVPLVVEAIQSTSYPDADTAMVELSSDAYVNLRRHIGEARDGVASKVRKLSREVAPDVDGWISRATQVQADIQESKATARAIVQQAETQEELQRNADDSAQKVALLQKELRFSKGLETALKEIKATSNRLAEAKELLVKNKVKLASTATRDVRDSLARVESSYARNAGQALRDRATGIEQDIVETASVHLRKSVRISADEESITVIAEPEKGTEIGLDECGDILTKLGALSAVARDVSRSLDQTYFSPWSSSERPKNQLETNEHSAKLIASGKVLAVPDQLHDVSSFVLFLSKALPDSLSRLVAEMLMPKFVERLEDVVLTPSIPLDIEHVGQLEALTSAVSNLSTTLSSCSWPGADSLRGWVDQAPRNWLSRQREHTLGVVRLALMHNLRQLRQAEKVETQIVEEATGEPLQTPSDDSGWDDEWTEQDGKSPAKVTSATTDGDDDGAAWDMEDKESSADASAKASSNGDEEEAAWGWDDEQAETQKQKDATSMRSPIKKAPGSKSITLREVYTVTGVPDALIQACKDILGKAQAMSEDQFSGSAVSSAITALFSIPTLAAALYRAMAVTAYDNVDSGKMLLYNDSIRLANQFKSLALGGVEKETGTALNGSVKRRLEQEVGAFERFAKLAYSSELESQKTILRDLMDGAQGFSNCTESPFADECESAIDMTVDRIGRVHAQWSDVLSRSALLQATGSMLSAVVSKFLIDIMELADIGEEESKKLLRFSKTISGLTSIFTEQHAQTGEVRDLTLLYCPNWLKFQYLGEVLDGNLADIKYLWIEGELSLEFEQDEIIDLIQALFADSDHRRKAISEIKGIRR